MAKTHFQCIKKAANYLTALKKEQHKKYIGIFTKGKKATIFFATMFAGRNSCKENALLTARLKLACGRGGSVHQGKIQCKLPQQCEHTGQ